MSMNNEYIHNRLRIFIDYKKISANQFGKKIGASSSQMSNILKGKKFVIDKLTTISEVYADLNIDWLVTGRGKMLVGENNELVVQQNLNSLFSLFMNTTILVMQTSKHLIEKELIKDKSERDFIFSFEGMAISLFENVNKKYHLHSLNNGSNENADIIIKDIVTALSGMYSMIDFLFENYKTITDKNYTYQYDEGNAMERYMKGVDVFEHFKEGYVKELDELLKDVKK